MKTGLSSKGYESNYSIEALRFIFACLIIYFHILHSNIMPYVSESSSSELYSTLQQNSNWASSIVECFLLISGYFLYQTHRRATDIPMVKLFWNRVVRLWPVLAFNALICLFLYQITFEDTIFDLLFLRTTGLSLKSDGILWYIGPFFWSQIIILGILRTAKKTGALILGITAYFAYTVNLNYFNGAFGRDVIFFFFSSGFAVVYAGVAVGVLLAMLLEETKSHMGAAKIHPAVTFIFCSVLELLDLALLLKIFVVGSGDFTNRFSIVALFGVLLILFLNQKGIVSRLLNQRFFGVLGKYAYSMYVMQQVSFKLLSSTFWANTDFLSQHVYLSLILSTLFSAAVGIYVYYLVEKPSIAIYKKIQMRSPSGA